MPSVTLNSYSKETHPWEWHIPPGANKLLIGTYPTELRNRKHNFFYCSSTNRFWEILSAVSGHPTELLGGANAVQERKNILDKLNLGLTDMGRIIYRQKGNSKDHSLFPIEFMDIILILKQYQTITTLLVSGDLQGNSSLSWFSIFCSLNKIKLNFKELKKQKSTEISITDRKIQVLLIYSPSRLSRIKTDELINSYKNMLLPTSTTLLTTT